MDAYLSSVYYDPAHPGAFATAAKLHAASRHDKKKYSLRAVESWLRKQDTSTINGPRRQNFPTRRTMAYGMDHIHQADLADMSNHARKNGGIHFLLVIVDVLSKFAWIRPLKNKSNAAVVEAFANVYGKSLSTSTPGTRIPNKLGTDQGTEFTGRTVQKLFKNLGIHHYVLYNRQKAAVAERLLRTIKGKIHKYMDSTGSERYIDRLQDFASAYNATRHRSIRMAPQEVTFSNSAKVWEQLYGNSRGDVKRFRGKKYKVSDKVRVSSYKKVFDKGYEKNYNDEILTVQRVLDTLPVTYKLEDSRGEVIKGSFYGAELTLVIVSPNKAYRIDYVVKTKGRGANKQWLIKYRGYANPEWSTSKPINIAPRR